MAKAHPRLASAHILDLGISPNPPGIITRSVGAAFHNRLCKPMKGRFFGQALRAAVIGLTLAGGSRVDAKEAL